MWLSTILIILICIYSYSEDVCKRGFTVIIDMRGSKWDLIKPLLKTLQEAFPAEIHVALIIKPDNFWQKQKTNFGSSKFIFEVRAISEMYGKALSLIRNVLQVKKENPKPCDWEKKIHLRTVCRSGLMPWHRVAFWAHWWKRMHVSCQRFTHIIHFGEGFFVVFIFGGVAFSLSFVSLRKKPHQISQYIKDKVL